VSDGKPVRLRPLVGGDNWVFVIYEIDATSNHAPFFLRSPISSSEPRGLLAMGTVGRDLPNDFGKP